MISAGFGLLWIAGGVCAVVDQAAGAVVLCGMVRDRLLCGVQRSGWCSCLLMDLVLGGDVCA